MRRLLPLTFLAASLPLLAPACQEGEGKEGGGDSGDDGRGGDSGDGGRGGGAGSGGAGDGGTDEPIPCRSDKTCTPHDLLCDTRQGICVECLSVRDCSDDALCSAGRCVEVTSCRSSKECDDDQVCDQELGYCVECIGDNDCGAGQICDASVCRSTCKSSKECAENDQVCGANGVCVDCEGDNDCASGQLCEENVCVRGACAPGSTRCDGDELLTCNARGSSFDSTVCPHGCAEEGGQAVCEDEGPVVGCAGETASPCDSIPRFTGTQIVDGNPNDFCRVPYKILNLSNAAHVGGPNGSSVDPSTIASNTSAQIRVAWSPTHLHVHVHVVDALLRPNPLSSLEYDGDNVQLFIQASAPTGGSIMYGSTVSGIIDDEDRAGQPQQIYLVPPQGETTQGTSRAVISWPEQDDYEWASRVTTDGYDVELRYPWPAGVAPLSANDLIGFNVMVGVNDSPPPDTTRDFEYALELRNVSGSSCGSVPSPWCDNRQWCAPSLRN